MNPFKQRSAFLSSLVTGWVGWTGGMFIGPLVFGFRIPAEVLFIRALCSALLQICLLRVLFFILQMHRHILVGAAWGVISAAGVFYLTTLVDHTMETEWLYWLLIYVVIGAPVGGFLSYFYIDDKKIFDTARHEKSDIRFGRDAHWLEPFVFGAAAYLIAFFPFTDIDLLVNVLIVGAVNGIFAAGSSHFSPDRWKRSYGLLALLVLVLGSLTGLLAGLLFRTFADELYTHYLFHGLAGGILTYMLTFLRGRQLAMKEERGEL